MITVNIFNTKSEYELTLETLVSMAVHNIPGTIFTPIKKKLVC